MFSSAGCRGNRDKPRFLLTTEPLRSTSIIIPRCFSMRRVLWRYGCWLPLYFFFFSFACMWLLCLGPERESLLQWMEVNEAGTSSEWQIVSQCLFYPDDFKGLKTPVATETHKSSAAAANSPSFSSLFHRCHHIKAHSQLLDTNEDA